MDPKEKENLEVTPEEQKAEEEALKEVKDDELREKIAEEMGIDPDVEGELLDKVVAREKANRTMLSGAIKQKRNWRERAEGKLNKEKPAGGDIPKEGDAKDASVDFDAKFQEKMDARDLKDLDLPEEIETEVKDLAKLKGISVREAVKHPYIISMQEKFDRDERIKNSSPKRTNKGSYASSVDTSKPLDPANFDFNSEEGIKAWNDAKKARRDYVKANE